MAAGFRGSRTAPVKSSGFVNRAAARNPQTQGVFVKGKGYLHPIPLSPSFRGEIGPFMTSRTAAEAAIYPLQ